MRTEPAGEAGEQRLELVRLLHHDKALRDGAQRSETGRDTAAVVAAVEQRALAVDDLARDDAGRTRGAQRVHLGGGERSAFHDMALGVDRAERIKREVAVGDAGELLADDRLVAKLLSQRLGRQHQRRVEIQALGVEPPGDLHGALVGTVGEGRAEIAAELHDRDILQIGIGHDVGDRIDRLAPGDADPVALPDQFEEHAGGEHRHLGRGIDMVAMRRDPDGVEAESVLDLARHHVVGEELRRGRDVDDAGLARLAQIHGDRRARNVKLLRDLILPQAVRIIEPRGLVDDLVCRSDCHSRQ